MKAPKNVNQEKDTEWKYMSNQTNVRIAEELK